MTNGNGRIKWIMGIFAGLLVTVGGYGFVRAITSASADEHKKLERRVDVIESSDKLILYKLDELKEDVNDLKTLIRKEPEK